MESLWSLLSGGASIAAGIRSVITIVLEKKDEKYLKTLGAEIDYSALSSDILIEADAVDRYIESRKTQFEKNCVISNIERKEFRERFYKENPDIFVYRNYTDEVIEQYLSNVEKVLLRRMTVGEKVLKNQQNRIEETQNRIIDTQNLILDEIGNITKDHGNKNGIFQEPQIVSNFIKNDIKVISSSVNVGQHKESTEEPIHIDRFAETSVKLETAASVPPCIARRNWAQREDGDWTCSEFFDEHNHPSQYKGGMKDGKRSGYGVLKTSFYTYSGNWENDMANGKGLVVFLAESEYKSFEGTFKDNQWANGKVIYSMGYVESYTGEFANNQWSGTGKLVSKDGWSYQGDFKKNMANGEGFITTRKGKVIYKGKWDCGRYVHSNVISQKKDELRYGTYVVIRPCFCG